MVTREQINALVPGANQDMVNAIVENWDVAENAGINNPKRIRQFLSNIVAETNLQTLTENMSYSTKGILNTWPKRFETEQEAAVYARNPELLAENVYGDRMGNRKGTGDGYRYRGRGFLQTTGRGGYANINMGIGKKYGVDFLDHPEKLAEPKFAFLAAVYEWETRGCNELADKGDTRAVRKAINGGDNGLDKVKLYLIKAEEIWPDGTVPSFSPSLSPSLSGGDNAAQHRKQNLAALAQVGPVPAEKPVRPNVPVPAEKPVRPKVPVSAEKPARPNVPVPAEKPVRLNVPVPAEKPARPKVPVPAQKPSSWQQGTIPKAGSATEASLTADLSQQQKKAADAFRANPKQALERYPHDASLRASNGTLDAVIHRAGRRHPMVAQMHRYLAKRIEHGKTIPTPKQAFKMISNALGRDGRGE